ncbi:PREDICTED: uncharacterized protein LOC109478251 [Branchiostoma belcheri]|uniref:Uncharacterized protein LOC109478251 n=1 Tax=Branchiostoma belcheri TaxID=7741 RepID=A0A6P5A0B3_BRABE|nr:PREDICTED: uncharacterized protein LOC109478251 [Branchiostoma belcheri]
MRTRRKLYRQKQTKKPRTSDTMTKPTEESEETYVCSRCRDRGGDSGGLFRTCVGCVSFGMWLLFCYLIFRMVLLALYPGLAEAEDGIGQDPVTCVQLTLPSRTMANIRGRMSQLQFRNI